MSPDTVYRPLGEYFEQSWPDAFPELPTDGALDEIYIEPPGLTSDDATALSSSLLFEQELALSVQGFDAVELLLAPGGLGTAVDFEIQVEPAFAFRIVDVPVALRLDDDLLQPVKPVSGSGGNAFEPDPNADAVEVTIATATVEIDGSGNVELDFDSSISLPPCMVGDSGLVIEATNLELYLGSGSPAGKPDGWRGVTLQSASLYLPDPLSQSVGTISISDAALGNGGFSGTVSTTWSPGKQVDLFGMDATLQSVSLTFVQNALTESTIEGTMTIPFFDDPVDIEIGIDLDGGLGVSLAGSQGALQTIEKEYFTLELHRIGFEIGDDTSAVLLGGVIDPKTDQMDADLSMPGVDIEELRVDAEGNVDIEGGWIELGDQYQAKVAGFGLEVTKFGFGKTDDGGKWIGFSGGIDLIKGISAGASVKGLRFEWGGDRDSMEVSLDGVGLEFEIPGTLKFKGEVSWEGQTFRGDIDLELIALDMTIDAELVFGTVTKNGSEFEYMGVYLDAQLPAGIPLWATGLSLYGFQGLFASQMEPDKTEGEKWYSVEEGESWYHNADPAGVVPLGEQWEPTEGSMGFGAGTTISTAPDSGLSVATDVLLAVVFPGPVIMVQGRADMMKPGAEVPDDAPFQALAVIDGRAGSLTLGIDAKYKEGDQGQLLDIAASVEAFFSFSDPGAWYLNIGKKEPRDARVRASALSVFTAESYFMLNPSRVATGIWYGYDKSWSFGPLSLTLEAWLDANAVLNFEPAHFTGSLHLHGKAAVKAFGVGIGLTVDAKIAAEVFDPFHLKGEFSASLSTPWPLPDPSATVTLEWGPTKDPPSLPEVVDEAGVGHEKLASTWSATQAVGPKTVSSAEPTSKPSDGPAADAPVVPQDPRPEVTFARPVHDDSSVTENPSSPNPAREVIGDPAKNEGPVDARYALTQLRLLEYDGNSWSAVEDVGGDWAPMPAQPKHGQGKQGADPDLVQTKLHLFARTPFAYSRHTGGAWEDSLSRSFPQYPCATDKQCWDFDDRSLETDFDREREYVRESDRTSITYRSHDQPWPQLTVTESGKVQSLQTLSVSIEPARGGGDALVLAEGDRQPDTEAEYPYEFYVSVPGSPRSVSLTFQGPKYEVEGEVVTLDDQSPLKESWSVSAGNDDPVVITAPGDGSVGFLTVRFRFPGEPSMEGRRRLSLLEICGSAVDLANPPTGTDSRVEQARDRLEALSERGQVLEPDTDYRLEVVTATDADGRGDFEYDETTYRAHYFDFHTAGPPGLETPDKPGEPPESGTEGKQSSGLATLARYVDQTTPATIPAEGERPPLPRPVYRTDPIGADFDVDYVDQQYRMAKRDLTLHLYDDNDRPVRDARGRLVLVDDEWGSTPELLLDRATARWLATVGESPCLDDDGIRIEATKRLERAAEERVLEPDAVHEARVKPLLFRERFDQGTDAWSATGGSWGLDAHDGFDGDSGTLQGDTLGVSGGVVGNLRAGLDTVTIETQSGTEGFGIDALDAGDDEITLDRTPSVGGPVEWSVPARSVAVQTGSTGGERFRLTDPPTFGGDPPDEWTDYRVAATVRVRRGGSGAVGITVRDTGSDRYRFELNTGGTRRLVHVENGSAAETWEASGGCDPGRDYRVAVEVIGDDLQVLVDDEPQTFDEASVVTVTDADGADSGTVGLYADTPDAQFDDVRIDDFRAGAPVAYRFAFTTSLFADARHHLQSFDDVVWPGSYPASELSGVTSVALGDDTSSAEFRDFRSVATALSAGEVDRLEVSRLDDDGTTKGLFVNSPEPIDWETTAIDLERGPKFDREPEPPEQLKLTDADPGAADVTALLRSDGDLSDYVIESRRPGAGFDPWLAQAGLSLESDLDEVGTGTWTFDGSVTGQTGGTLSLLGDAGGSTVAEVTVSTGDATAGLRFRRTAADSHYRFVGDSDGLQLVRTDGSETVLWEGGPSITADTARTLTVELVDGRIRGRVDGVPCFDVADPGQGGLGRTGPTVADGTATVETFRTGEDAVVTTLDRREFETSGLGDWDIVDEPPYTTQESDWHVSNGRLRQTSNIYGFVGGDYNAPGTYAVTGEAWSDYRLTTRLSAGDNDAIGLMFRYQDDGNCYRFSMDNQRSYRRLIARIDGEVRLLWSDEDTGYVSGREYVLTIECVGDRLRGYLDGEELFDVRERSHASGQVGCYTRANEDASFHDLQVTAPADTWREYHRFGEQPPMPAGTRLSIADSAPSWAGEARTDHHQPSSGRPLPTGQTVLRVRDPDGTIAHVRPFRDATYTATSVDVLRSEDGTGLVLYDSNGLDPGAYRLTLSPDGSDSPLDGPVSLDLPWVPRS